MSRRPLGYKDRFSRDRRTRFFRKIILILCAILIALGFAIYFLFFHHLFDIRSIDIKGAQDSTSQKIHSFIEDSISKRFLFIKRSSNIFLISKNDLQALIMSQFPEIETSTITRADHHSLHIEIVERRPSFIYCIAASQVCYNTDIEGLVYDETVPSSGSIFIRITDQRPNISIEKGKTIDKKEFLPMFQALRDILQKQNIGVSQYIIPDIRLDELEIQTTAGWKILLNTQTDLQKQIIYFISYFQKAMTSDQKNNLQYVDLRLPERIYFK